MEPSASRRVLSCRLRVIALLTCNLVMGSPSPVSAGPGTRVAGGGFKVRACEGSGGEGFFARLDPAFVARAAVTPPSRPEKLPCNSQTPYLAT
jgi:hypothetical protein